MRRREARGHLRGELNGLRRGDRARLDHPPQRAPVDQFGNDPVRAVAAANFVDGDQAMSGDYLGDRAARRFAGTPLRCLVTGFGVSAALNNCPNPCSNSSTASPRRQVARPGLSRRTGASQTMGDAIFSRLNRMIPSNEASRQQPDTITGLNER